MLQTKRRVLVVDDHEASADVIRLLLDERGHQTEVAYGGHQALELARRFAPHLVLLDLSLPGVPGDEVARRIRAEHGTRRPRLVALSGYDDTVLRARCANAGFDDFGTKPERLEDLEAFLDAQLV